ncbi:MAG: hypothetical protein RRY79_04660 [Clostridia bacterium]
MALGVKVKTIKTEKKYTLDEFFEAIKEESFAAGIPSMTKHGPTTVITFPALDSQNQVWIIKCGFGERVQKFSIQKSQQAGVGNMAANMALDELSGGFFGAKSIVGKNAKQCEQLVETTFKELEALNL